MASMSSELRTLTAAFSFGILLQAATAATFIYFKGHGSTILQDAPRLVLVLFLLFVALWAQVDFVNLLLSTKSTSICQGTLIASTTFDQLARVAIEQFLLWSIGRGVTMSTERIILQGLWVIRLIAGGIFVGLSRPEFAPTCIPQTSVMPIAIVVICLDFLIVIILLIRLGALGMFRSLGENKPSMSLILTVAGFSVWTGTSVARLLGISGTHLSLRTALPAAGLLFLIGWHSVWTQRRKLTSEGIITLSSGALLAVKKEELTTPEARSPFTAPAVQTREILRENYGNGSPRSGNLLSKSGQLFVVNQTPRESSMSALNRNSDNRGFRRMEDEQVESGENEQVSRRGPGYRGSSGVFGAMVGAPIINGNGPAVVRFADNPKNDQLPQLPASSILEKKSMFSWGKPKPEGKIPIRSLGISNPIMNEIQGPANRSFNKIPTIDLATAAINEKERRRVAAARSQGMIMDSAHRPSDPPMNGLRQSMSITRKMMPALPQEMSTPTEATSTNLLIVDSQATSTSASLSPAREEVRRRSPRVTETFNQQRETPMATAGPQRRPTIGLPSNPRAQRNARRDENKSQGDTVMLLNNIVYTDPDMVKSIMDDASGLIVAPKRSKVADPSPIVSYTPNLKSSDSIIHRPRPYRKDSDADRALFPFEASPSHKRTISGSRLVLPNESTKVHQRSKSSSAVTTRQSVFNTPIGSPTTLPPLPPMPRTAAELRRLLPNDTKSMTFNEKIELLFPAPPQLSSVQRRRSSVPSLPRVPSVFLADSQFSQSPVDETSRSRRTSKRTTGASFKTVISANRPKSIDAHHIVNFNPDEFVFAIKAARESKPAKATRKSPTIVATSTDQDDTTSYWGSIHSKAPQVDLNKARLNARSTFIQPRDSSIKEAELSDRPDSPIEHTYTESIPVMLDLLEESKFSEYSPSYSNRRSFFVDDNESFPGEFLAPPLPSWHYRIGDSLPTFSAREHKTRSRKMPPPTPLLLSRMGRMATIVVHAEPSPVESPDSPQRAIESIKAQLDRLEDQGRSSDGDLHDDSTQLQIEDRLRLLENLEMEMGQQQDQWQMMQSNLDRNSLATTVPTLPSTPQPPTQNDFSRNASKRESRRQSRLASHTRNRSSTSERSEGRRSSSTSSTENSGATMWQQRLAEAQMEYLDNAPSLLGKNVNFFAVSKAQLGSPTPPESVDSGTDVDTESDIESVDIVAQIGREAPSLWRATLPSPKGAFGRLWSHPYEKPGSQIQIPEPAAKNLRPAQRILIQPLTITSSTLWSKSSPVEIRRSAFGLWRSQAPRPVSIVIRRASVRPERRNRRMTILPDIVESPLPVSNDRYSAQLGIFRFPWGEVSDQPVYQPLLGPYHTTSTMSSQFAMRSHELEPESSEYSSSFFDDYDEEEEGDEEANYDSESENEGRYFEDDEYDESTLDDIADLLQSTEVPSRQSMFSPQAIIEDYDAESDYGSNDEAIASLPPMRLPIQPLAMISRFNANVEKDIYASSISEMVEVFQEPTLPEEFVSSVVEKAFLWTPKAAKEEARKSGMFAVLNGTAVVRGTTAAPAAIDMTKTMIVSKATLPKLSSQDLWSDKATEAETNWLSASSIAKTQQTSFTPQLLWSLPSKSIEHSTYGLFSLSGSNAGRRTTELEPAAATVSRRPTSVKTSLAQLESNELWNGSEYQPTEHHWITESSVRPSSPSIYSASSSGRTSPASLFDNEETSDASSFMTASTKASSLWSSVTRIPAWWDSKSKKTPAKSPVKVTSTPIEEQRGTFKIPTLRRQKPEVLPTVRESRVLASRDLWEAMSQGGGTSVKEIASSVGKISPAPSHKIPVRRQDIVASTDAWKAALDEATVASQAVSVSKASINSSKLWSSPSKALVMPAQSSLWSKDSSKTTPTISHMSPAANQTRKVLPKENPNFSVLKSDTLWNPVQQIDATERHWISHKPVADVAQAPLKRSLTWTSRPSQTPITTSTSLWSLPFLTAPLTPGLFAHIKTEAIKTRPAASLPALQSLDTNTLFEVSAPHKEQDVNWLHSTCISSISTSPTIISPSTPIEQLPSLTWTSQTPVNRTRTGSQSGLWNSPMQMLISNEPWTRRKRVVEDVEVAIVGQVEGLWRPFGAEVEEERNWIMM